MKLNLTLNSLLIWLSLTLQSINAITYNQTLEKGHSLGTPDTLVSANGIFELGFFDRQNSTKHYAGIRFKNVPTDNIVWVANRKNAATDSSAVLTIYDDGNIVVKCDENVYFVSNVSGISSTYAMLLDSGNLVLLNSSNLNVVWQSFDHPTNTILPEMKIGLDGWSLRSWASVEDPSPGVFSLIMDSERLIIRKESRVYWIYDDLINFTHNFDIKTDRVGKDENLPWRAESKTSRLVLEVSGELNKQYWSEENKRWVSEESSKCASRATCGNFGICNPQATKPCECVEGFRPYDENSWKKGNISAGCVRRTELRCSDNIRYVNLDRVDFPSNRSLIFEFEAKEPSACQNTCSTNCSCVAYAYNFTRRCLLWHDQLLNLKNVSVDSRDDKNISSVFLKLAATEFIDSEPKIRNDSHHRLIQLITTLVILFVALLTVALFVYCYRRRKLRNNGEDLLLFDVGMSTKVGSSEPSNTENVAEVNNREIKLPFFSFSSVSAATDNFSAANKLGEGGFGPVYKGMLLNGDEVAVKRLSARSGQGWEELKNEAMLIAKLQHNNLVRLLGCCIEQDEKMLIYEFMPNKSLDFFLFDATKSRILDWETRVRITDGIAQGLLYLHQYSRFRIIHRDLKASNILLDVNMNPKISDFGMARLFGGNELQTNTNRIVGTYGYMSPEYALEGIFSIKSDVFSFGILLLEIISGKKNTGLYNTNSLNLLGYAWDLWISGRGIELMDSAVEDASIKKTVVLRFVNIALLCVQERAEDRPTMSDVVSMLGNESIVLPFPKPIAFLNVRGIRNSGSDGSSVENVSMNNMTASVMEAR